MAILITQVFQETRTSCVAYKGKNTHQGKGEKKSYVEIQKKNVTSNKLNTKGRKETEEFFGRNLDFDFKKNAFPRNEL